MDPKLKSLLSVVATTAVGAFVGALTPALNGGIPSGPQLKSILACAALAAVAAVVHLFQTPPGAPPSLPTGGANVATMILVVGLAFGVTGCTKQQTVNVENATTTVLTDAQKACVIGEVVAPDLGLNAATVADMKIICDDVGLAKVADEDIIAFINALTGSQKAVAAEMLKRQAKMMGAWPLAPLGKPKPVR